jgi:putative tryptophan/tyrosine transport system substrate-binding protein
LAGVGGLTLSRTGWAELTHRLGFISSSTTGASSPFLVALRRGLKSFGYEDSRNIKIEYRFGQTKDQLAKMASELVALGVDVILAGGSEGITAAKAATKTIPIVMTNSGDAVREGFVNSLARPGGNITGLTQISSDWRVDNTTTKSRPHDRRSRITDEI